MKCIYSYSTGTYNLQVSSLRFGSIMRQLYGTPLKNEGYDPEVFIAHNEFICIITYQSSKHKQKHFSFLLQRSASGNSNRKSLHSAVSSQCTTLWYAFTYGLINR